MAKSVGDILKLTRSQMNAFKKDEIVDIAIQLKESFESSDSSVVNFQVLIDSISKLTTEITGLKTSLNDHQETNRKQIDELKAANIKAELGYS